MPTTLRAPGAAPAPGTAAAALALAALLSPAHASSNFIPLHSADPAVLARDAGGVSADGSIVVGTAITPAGSRAFRWTAATGVTLLPTLADSQDDLSYAAAISDDGSTVAGLYYDNPDIGFGAVWNGSGSAPTDIDPAAPLGSLTSIAGANADGSVLVGFTAQPTTPLPFRWTESAGLQTLGLLPGDDRGFARAVSSDGRIAVGYSDTAGSASGPRLPVRWTPDGTPQALTTPTSDFLGAEAHAVDADGDTIAGSVDLDQTDGLEQAFRWTEAGGFSLLQDLPGGENTSAVLAMSDDGSVLAGYGFDNDENRADAVLWIDSDRPRKLADILTNDFGADLTGWRLTLIRDISPDGRFIVGDAINPAGDEQAFLAIIPGPGTAALAIFATAAAARLRTRAPLA